MQMPKEFEEVCRMYESGEITTRKAAEILGVSHATFYRKYKEVREKIVSNSRLFDTYEKARNDSEKL